MAKVKKLSKDAWPTSKKWIEKKAYKLFARLLTINGPFAEAQAMRDFIKDFLRNLIQELRDR